MKTKLLILILTSSCCFILKAQKLTFCVQWTPQTQFAGYYMAKDKGYYKERGLDVSLIHPNNAENTVDYLIKGSAQFVMMNLSQALFYKLHGVNLVNVLQSSQVNSLMLVSHYPLRSMKDLKGRSIAIWKYINTDMLNGVLKKYGLSNSQIVRFNSGVNVFLSKAADVSIVGSYNEFPQLAECGYRVKPGYMLRLSDCGYDMPEEGIYTLKSYYDTHKDVVRRFVAACKKGWQQTFAHQDEAIKCTDVYINKFHVPTNGYHQRCMLTEILRLQKDRHTGKRTFMLSESSFDSALSFIAPGAIKYSDFVK
jgi:NitT/TauT family transport system substrate-binding protein